MSVVTISESNFKENVLDSKKTVVLDFYADWCGPCKMFSPVLHKLAEEICVGIHIPGLPGFITSPKPWKVKLNHPVFGIYAVCHRIIDSKIRSPALQHNTGFLAVPCHFIAYIISVYFNIHISVRRTPFPFLLVFFKASISEFCVTLGSVYIYYLQTSFRYRALKKSTVENHNAFRVSDISYA